METVVEYVLKAIAVVVLVVGVIGSGLVLLVTTAGLMTLFVALMVAVTTLSVGTALLAIDFLYPQAVVVSGFSGLLWLVVPASLASVVIFDLALEGVVLRVVRRWGLGMPRIRPVEGVLGGAATALALVVTARFVPDAELSPGAALLAGLIGAFVRYYLATWIDDTALGGFGGAEADFFDGEQD